MSMEDSGPGEPPPAEARWRADIEVEVAALRRDVGRLHEIIREHAEVLAETVPRVGTLEEHLDQTRGQVRGLLATSEHTTSGGDIGGGDASREDAALREAEAALGLRPDPPGPWCWALLDAEQAEKAWHALSRWVASVFVPTYAITRGELVDCWPAHSEMVAELSWLRDTYLEAHRRGAGASESTAWHLRCKPGALAAIRGAIRWFDLGHRQEPVCGPEHHLTPPSRLLRAPASDLAARELATIEHWGKTWREVMATDVAARRAAPSGRPDMP